ncbi:MAG: ROK family protein [Clostridia bacterium]|nr:ROK family protein [Clostridia bacterium]
MYIGAIDMGGSKTIVGVLNEKFEILAMERFEGHEKDWRVHFDRTIGLLRVCTEKLNIAFEELSAIGVVPPGMVRDERYLLLAPATGWRDLDMIEEYRKRTGIEIIATDCDVNASAIAEADITGERDFLWYNISNGIGAAIIMNGDNMPGANGVSGELGHVKVEYEQPRPCPCGQKGCCEAHASGAAIGRRVQQLAQERPEYAELFKNKGYPVNAYGASLLARENDPTSLEVFQEAGKYIGRSIAVGLNVINPPRVYVGGGVSQSLDLLLPEIRRQIELCTVEFARNVPIERTHLGYYAALKGATAIALRKYARAKEIT